MDEFIGRRRELALLEGAYRDPGSAFIPIYGRRRIGKSELLLRFLSQHPGIYIVGKQAPPAIQLRELMDVAARHLDEPLLASAGVGSWHEALRLLDERWRGEGKLILALDEFQWMAASSPELPSVLQELWDRQWQKSGRVLLILCGSYVGFMEREVLGKKSPLFGRRTAQIHLRPFGFGEARRFHPDHGPVEAARTYFVCGGVPLYLRAFRAEKSVEANIRDTLLDEYAPLHSEPDFLLREELRDVHNYYAVLMALSAGSLPVADIAARTSVSERTLPYHLNQLVELGYVRRRHPLSPGRRNPRQVRFALDDPLLRFWFRFVYPNLSSIRQLGPRHAFDRLLRPELEAWMGLAFERLCREAMPALYAAEGVSAAFEVGEFWSRDLQLDLVSLRDEGWIDLGECRWGGSGSPAAAAAALRAKAERYPNPRNATLQLRVFTRNAVRRPRRSHPDIRWHCLSELYAAAEDAQPRE
jgi:uncharacterized protein